jgi:hypothetical protein
VYRSVDVDRTTTEALNGGRVKRLVDLAHATILALSVALGILGMVASLVGFVILSRGLRKDEALDSMIFLTLRRLEEHLKSGGQPPGRPA